MLATQKHILVVKLDTIISMDHLFHYRSSSLSQINGAFNVAYVA